MVKCTIIIIVKNFKVVGDPTKQRWIECHQWQQPSIDRTIVVYLKKHLVLGAYERMCWFVANGCCVTTYNLPMAPNAYEIQTDHVFPFSHHNLAILILYFCKEIKNEMQVQ